MILETIKDKEDKGNNSIHPESTYPFAFNAVKPINYALLSSKIADSRSYPEVV